VRQYVRWVYTHWSGRWAAFGLEALLLSKLPVLSIYSLVLWALQVVQLLGLLAFWHTVVGSTISLPGRLTLALGSYAFLLAGYPDPGQTVYWVSGGIEYQFSVALALLLMAAVCASTRFPLRTAQTVPRALALSLLGLAITGFHELVALMLLGVLFTGTVVVWRERRPNLEIWLILLVVVTLGTAVSLLAPGNLERAAIQFPNGHSAGERIIAFARLLIRLLRWIDVKLLAASILLALIFGSQLLPRQGRASMRIWAIPFAGVTILLGSCAAVACITGGPGNGRTQSLLYTAFCIAWVTSLFTLLGVAPRPSYRADHAPVRLVRHGAAVLLCVSMLASANNGSTTRDLVLEAPAWGREMAHRYELMRRAARLDGPTADVVVPSVVHFSTFFRDLDIGPNSGLASNHNFAAHFGVRSVRVGDSQVVTREARVAEASELDWTRSSEGTHE
jgi:Family of unknown function (DUF6056)